MPWLSAAAALAHGAACWLAWVAPGGAQAVTCCRCVCVRWVGGCCAMMRLQLKAVAPGLLPASRQPLSRSTTCPATATMQLEKSGAELKIVVATNQVRVDSEIASFEEGVNSGSMAADFTLAGGWAGGVLGWVLGCARVLCLTGVVACRPAHHLHSQKSRAAPLPRRAWRLAHAAALTMAGPSLNLPAPLPALLPLSSPTQASTPRT